MPALSDKPTLKIAMLAGEASGDQLGANLMLALRERHPNIQFEGIGGPLMAAAGFKNLFDIERLSVMGFVEPLKRLPDLIKLRYDLYRHFNKNRPDVFVGIDAPDFNLGLEVKLRKINIPVVHYVSPSVWAWRQYRIRKIKKAVDLMLTLFPFEAAFYEKHQVPVCYVGHPIADHIPMQTDVAAARRSLGLDVRKKYIALLPGSRNQELTYLAEPYILAAKQAWLKQSDLVFLSSHVNEARFQQFQDCYQRLAPEVPIVCFQGRAHDVMAAADAIIVTSGTATLEAMLYKKPMIIAYRMPALFYKLVRWLVKAPYAGLPNLLANKLLVPELFQEDANPEAIASQLLDYLDHPEKVDALQKEFAKIHTSLQCHAGARAAEAILALK